MWNTRIANYMNEQYPNPNKIWTKTTVLPMLKNQIYTVRLHMNATLSEPIEELRLVSDDDFHFAQHATKQRIHDRYAARHEEEDAMVPQGRTKTSVFGASTVLSLFFLFA